MRHTYFFFFEVYKREKTNEKTCINTKRSIYFFDTCIWVSSVRKEARSDSVEVEVVVLVCWDGLVLGCLDEPDDDDDDDDEDDDDDDGLRGSA